MAEGQPTFEATIWCAGTRIPCRVRMGRTETLVPLDDPRLAPGTGVRFEVTGHTFRYSGAGQVEAGGIRVLHWDGPAERQLRTLVG